jgi:hypothetical protein
MLAGWSERLRRAVTSRTQAYNSSMGLELVREGGDVIMRVDGDVLELFDIRYPARRIPLAWLVVRAQPERKNTVQVVVGQQNVDQPLYALGKTAGVYNAYAVSIDAEEEPSYREFFTEVAQLCGRSVAQRNDP